MDINVCRVDLLSLIPKCAICEQTFDLSIRSPQILPCSHTFCLMCITKKTQRKRRRCWICNEKYAVFRSNVAYLVLITSINLFWQRNEQQSLRCEECDKQQLISELRRCVTCEIQIQQRLKHSDQTCCICLECCVNNHNGHDLRRLICRTTPNRNLCRYDTKSSLTRTPLLPIKKASDTPSQASGCSQSISDSTSIRSSNWQENIPTEFKNIEQLESISNSGSFLENVNYTNRLNSDAVVSSTNSGQSSSFIKVQSNTIETDSLPEDGHIPNMPRRRHFRASRTALRNNSDTEVDTEAADEVPEASTISKANAAHASETFIT